MRLVVRVRFAAFTWSQRSQNRDPPEGRRAI